MSILLKKQVEATLEIIFFLSVLFFTPKFIEAEANFNAK